MELRIQGYTPSFNAWRNVTWSIPSPDTLAASLWSGPLHMGAAVAELTRRPEREIETIELYHYTGRQRDPNWAALTAAVLVMCACMLVYCTVRMLRQKFTPSLNSYAAARLLVDYSDLVDGQCCGELGQSKSLCTAFHHVGDAAPDRPVGHVAVGGGAVLKARKREYVGYP